MLTLTYPGDWLSLAPDGETAKRHFAALRKRYARQWGRPLAGVWKMEFQRRGSVHFHVFCAPPARLAFRSWLSDAWTDVVGAEGEERERHRSAGTAIDRATGLRASTPNAVAVYFAKHSSANYGDKEYQNRPPAAWLEAGSVGRFWGVLGLRPVEAPAGVSEEVALFAARVLRKWARSRAVPRREVVWRTDRRTGVVRKRHVRRYPRRLRGSSGFVAAQDAPYISDLLALAIAKRFPENVPETGYKAPLKKPDRI